MKPRHKAMMKQISEVVNKGEIMDCMMIVTFEDGSSASLLTDDVAYAAELLVEADIAMSILDDALMLHAHSLALH